jgi:hypothetical protein
MNNVEGAAGQYRAAITSTGPTVAMTPSVQATLPKGQRQDLAVSVTSRTEGVSTLSLQVTGPADFALSHSYDIQTRSPYLPASQLVRRTLQPGESWTPDANVLASFAPGSGSVQISFSPIPMDAASLFDSLDRYPYGCTEQIVSRAMPMLYANQMAALAGRKTAVDLRNQIQGAISVLLNREGSDGAMGLWRVGDQEATPWLGAYAVDFLARAKALGYVVPDAALDKAYDGLMAFTSQEDSSSAGYNFAVFPGGSIQETSRLLLDRSIAYGAYVLARAGRMDRSRLRYLHDARLDRIPSPLARAQIGTALYMIGDNARATSAFDRAEGALGYRHNGDYYATPRRDLAGVMALAAEARMQDRVTRLTNPRSRRASCLSTARARLSGFLRPHRPQPVACPPVSLNRHPTSRSRPAPPTDIAMRGRRVSVAATLSSCGPDGRMASLARASPAARPRCPFSSKLSMPSRGSRQSAASASLSVCRMTAATALLRRLHVSVERALRRACCSRRTAPSFGRIGSTPTSSSLRRAAADSLGTSRGDPWIGTWPASSSGVHWDRGSTPCRWWTRRAEPRRPGFESKPQNERTILRRSCEPTVQNGTATLGRGNVGRIFRRS